MLGATSAAQALHVPELPEGASLLEAALLYAEAGWYLLPTRRETKHAGSALGRGWPAKSSRDPEILRRWFRTSAFGLALHVGRSGALAFDVDNVAEVPGLLRHHLALADPPFQSTRRGVPARGHYFFAQPSGLTLGNGKGALSGHWGDVRGANGIVIADPTRHEKHEEGGRYHWKRTGRLPMLPSPLVEALQPGPRHRVRTLAAPRPTPGPGRRAGHHRAGHGSFIQLVQRVLDAKTERNVTLFEAACRAGELIAVGRLDRTVAVEALAAAGRATGLEDDELLGRDGRSGTVNSGLDTGMASQRSKRNP